MPHPVIEQMPLARLKPHPRNARIHSREQIAQIARSIERFGFTSPVLIGGDNETWDDVHAANQ